MADQDGPPTEAAVQRLKPHHPPRKLAVVTPLQGNATSPPKDYSPNTRAWAKSVQSLPLLAIVTDPYSGSDDLEDQGNASEGRSTGEDEGGSGFESSNADEHCDADKVEEEGPFACEEYEAGTDNTVQELGSPGSCTCTEAVADAMFEANEKATTYPVDPGSGPDFPDTQTAEECEAADEYQRTCDLDRDSKLYGIRKAKLIAKHLLLWKAATRARKAAGDHVNVSLSLQSGPPVCKRPTYEYMKAVSDAASLAYNSLPAIGLTTTLRVKGDALIAVFSEYNYSCAHPPKGKAGAGNEAGVSARAGLRSGSQLKAPVQPLLGASFLTPVEGGARSKLHTLDNRAGLTVEAPATVPRDIKLGCEAALSLGLPGGLVPPVTSGPSTKIKGFGHAAKRAGRTEELPRYASTGSGAQIVKNADKPGDAVATGAGSAAIAGGGSEAVFSASGGSSPASSMPSDQQSDEALPKVTAADGKEQVSDVSADASSPLVTCSRRLDLENVEK